jgi:hypothetical protein
LLLFPEKEENITHFYVRIGVLISSAQWMLQRTPRITVCAEVNLLCFHRKSGGTPKFGSSSGRKEGSEGWLVISVSGGHLRSSAKRELQLRQEALISFSWTSITDPIF